MKNLETVIQTKKEPIGKDSKKAIATCIAVTALLLVGAGIQKLYKKIRAEKEATEDNCCLEMQEDADDDSVYCNDVDDCTDSTPGCCNRCGAHHNIIENRKARGMNMEKVTEILKMAKDGLADT